MVEKYISDSDLTIVLEPVSDVASISIGLWIKSGSRNETKEQYGYAHFVEHMLFKGTENFSAKEIAKQIDRVGGQHNAATNREYTCYYINVVSDYLELAVKILSEMYYSSLFAEEELAKEKNVIIEEIKMYEDSPDELIHDLFMKNMLHGHPLSHAILGDADGIGKVSREDLLKFYNQNYINENAALVIAGNFIPEKAKSLISNYFNKKSSHKLESHKTTVLPKRLEYQHIEKSLEQVHFCLGTEGVHRSDADRWPLYLLSTILGGSMSSRLFQNIREKEGISYSIYSFHSSYSDHGVFGIYCATVPDKYERALDLIVKECRDIVKNSVDKAEFEDAKTFLIGNLALSYESIEVRMGQLAKNEISFGKNFSFQEIVNSIKSVSMDDFINIVDRILGNTKFSLVSLGNVKNDINKKIDLQI